MSYTLNVRELSPERIAFGCNVAHEALLSLHVYCDSKHHSLHISWVKQARKRLSAQLKAEIESFRVLFQRPVPVFWEPKTEEGSRTFASDLQDLSSMDTASYVQAFLRPIFRRDVDVSALRRGDELLLQELWDKVNTRAPGSKEVVQQAVVNPEASRSRLSDLLEAYWEQLFQEEWEHLEEMFVTDIEAMRKRLLQNGQLALWRDLSPDVDVDAERKKVIIRRPSRADISFTREDTLTFVPSFFSWPHLFVRLEKPVVINYPLRSVLEEARMPDPPEKLLLAYRALGDACRYQILQYLSKKPRSTGELAGLLRLSEAAVSKHLRLLLEAGLVTSERESYYVYYRLQHETLRKLGDWTITIGR